MKSALFHGYRFLPGTFKTLYIGTLRFNILLGAARSAEEVTQEEIEKACRDGESCEPTRVRRVAADSRAPANILDFIQSLPEGFETQVGGKGSQLSGGQKRKYFSVRLESTRDSLTAFRTNRHRQSPHSKSKSASPRRGKLTRTEEFW